MFLSITFDSLQLCRTFWSEKMHSKKFSLYGDDVIFSNKYFWKILVCRYWYRWKGLELSYLFVKGHDCTSVNGKAVDALKGQKWPKCPPFGGWRSNDCINRDETKNKMCKTMPVMFGTIRKVFDRVVSAGYQLKHFFEQSVQRILKFFKNKKNPEKEMKCEEIEI